jgi:gliding motility associated protien GldN
MQTTFKCIFRCFLILLAGVTAVRAQNPAEIEIRTEIEAPEAADAPLDEVVKKDLLQEARSLPYQPIRERDLVWEKRVWRIIDVREKMNLPFACPEAPFFKLLADAAVSGELPVYSTEDDKFTKRLRPEAVREMLSKTDTVPIYDLDTGEESITVVQNDLSWEDVRRFRIKEVCFFDQESSTMQTRILGIAPLIDVKDNEGNFRFERPLFWVYYPQARDLFARNRVVTLGGNTNTAISWDDLFEMRYFAGYIYKASNVYDRKIDEYLTGVDLLMESEKIKNDIFNWEHDQWQY